MKNIDNKLEKLGEDIKNEVKIGDKMYIASAVFSMYGYEELKDRLKIIDEFNFIFTNPTFLKHEKESKQERKFEIDNYTREKSVAGSEFEIKLKNGILYNCYGHFANISFGNRWKATPNKVFTLLGAIPGYFLFLRWKKEYIEWNGQFYTEMDKIR